MKIAMKNNSAMAKTADITHITTKPTCFDSSSITSGMAVGDVDVATKISEKKQQIKIVEQRAKIANGNKFLVL